MFSMSDVLKPINPVKPVAAYIGGKKQLSTRLAALSSRVPHVTYAEPFIGMGGVFLRRQCVPKAEVINDISTDVANLFRILQRHYVPLMDMLRFTFTSRREFERLKATDPLTLTDLERAVRFLYLQRCAYGGKVSGRNFGVSVAEPGRFDVTKLEPMLADLNERLSGVIIENLPYGEFIDRYDAPGTLFYCDPPYYGCERDYGPDVFSRDDFAALAERFARLRGIFIMSLNDTPEVRSIFSAFDQEAVELSYTVGCGHKSVSELIITPSGLALRPEPQGMLFSG